VQHHEPSKLQGRACSSGVKNTDTRLARCAGRHKKTHYFWACDQSHSQID
jgi:hypothetical protein